MRKAIREYDAFIFFMPEYNRSYAPAIKNAIDIGARGPQGNAWAQKPATVFTASTGSYGGMAGNHALRQSVVFVDVMPMQQQEVYLSKVDALFSEDGELQERTKDLLKKRWTFLLRMRSVLSIECAGDRILSSECDLYLAVCRRTSSRGGQFSPQRECAGKIGCAPVVGMIGFGGQGRQKTERCFKMFVVKYM